MIGIKDALQYSDKNKVYDMIKWSDGGKVDWTMTTSFPLTVSSIEGENSPSLKRWIMTLPNLSPKALAMPSPNV